MSYIYHCYLAQIPQDSNVGLADLHDEIQRRYHGQPREISLILRAGHLSLQLDSYTFDLRHVDGPHVLAESGAMARYYDGDDPAAKPAIQGSTRRFELSGDDDPNLDYQEDATILCNVLHSLGITWIFDPFRGKFIQV